MKTQHTPAQLSLLKKLEEHGGATRVWTGRDEVWLCNREPCTRVISALIKKGLVGTHYPSGSGSAWINEAGRTAIAKAGAV
jgi:hypothetical protein